MTSAPGWQVWADATLAALDPGVPGLDEAALAPDRFGVLVRRLGADRAATAALALLAAVELDRGRQLRCRELARDDLADRATLGLLHQLGLHRAVAPGSLLDRAGLVEVETQGPWSARQVGLPPRLVRHLDDADGAAVATSALPAAARLLPPRGGGLESGDDTLLLVSGADRYSRRAAVAAAHPARPLLLVRAGEASLPGLVCEAVLTGAVLLLETTGPLHLDDCRTVERAPVPVAISSPAELAVDSLPQRRWQEVRVPSGMAGSGDWVRTVGRPGPDGVDLDRDQLARVGLVLDGGPRATGRAPRRSDEQIGAAVRRIASGELDRMARRTEPRHGWADLVLPSDQIAQLRELAARHRHRGRVHDDWGFRAGPGSGVVALFAGPSGTGKTMAAEVVAGDLGLDLYRVDLAAVVSKYIGETEKNLDQIFDAARAAAAVLLFDEADALFGKRTEVSDSHDRYANIEVSYLLQRLENHDGCVVLTTNLKRNIDPAFVRRLSLTVDFPTPAGELRRRLWHQQIPATAPTGVLDLDFLADRFEITGGMIHNAVLAAAFLAADRDEPIGMPHLVSGLARELQKAGRLQSEADFEPYRTLLEVDRAEPVG